MDDAPHAPLVLRFDIEPVPQHDVAGTRDEWLGFPNLVAGIDRWRDLVLKRTGYPLQISWAMRIDDQIEGAYGSLTWVVENFGALLEYVQAQGDEVGLHSHAYRWDDAESRWYCDYEDASWLEARLGAWIEAFEGAFGHRPPFFVSGDGWLANGMFDVLERYGVPIDLSVEPGRPGGPGSDPDRGVYPDYRFAPREPYRPARSDFLQRGSSSARRLWELPNTTLCVSRPEEWHVTPHRRHDVQKIYLGVGQAWTRRMLDVALARRQLFGVSARTGAASDPKRIDNFWSNLEYLFEHPLLAEYAVETPAAALRRWQRSQRLRQPALATVVR